MSKKAPCMAVLGTGSDVGKSIVTTALCRIFASRGLRVAPFKAQNMSNNSGVTPEGLEMGRAQIVQAEAAGIPPHADMNPILLKPTSDLGAQVVFLGRALGNSTAKEYHLQKMELFDRVCATLDRLREKHDLIIMEGAGSCAEVNLMEHDMVNLPMAMYAKAPCLLTADIHKGGVFAQIVGTLACLENQDHLDLIRGFVINRFRGDIDLFDQGVKWIEGKTGRTVFGVLPWYDHIRIEAEDSVVIEKPAEKLPEATGNPTIAVIRLPRISNFTDFEPLEKIRGLDIAYAETPGKLSGFTAVVIPGSKSTVSDLLWLRESGWADILLDYAEKGGRITGICGGYQMMGDRVHDPDGLEGKPGSVDGLGLLPAETLLRTPKTTTRTEFSWADSQGLGYEIHMGETSLNGGTPLFSVHSRNAEPCMDADGCASPDMRMMGTYIHGLFDSPGVTRRWLEHLGLGNLEVSEIQGPAARDRQYDLLAEHFEKHVNIKKLEKAFLF